VCTPAGREANACLLLAEPGSQPAAVDVGLEEAAHLGAFEALVKTLL
jgi:hypothetical protein